MPASDDPPVDPSGPGTDAPAPPSCAGGSSAGSSAVPPSHPVRRAGGAVLRGIPRWGLRLTLPLAGAAAALHSFPYRATVQGVSFTVQGSLFARPGLSADTTLGSWIFPKVDALPFGVHITPRDVDVLALSQRAGSSLPAFVQRLQSDFAAQVPRIAGWLLGELLLGMLLGLAAAAAVNMSVRYLRGIPRRVDEVRRRMFELGGATAAILAVAGYGVLGYNPDWVRQSKLTGTLAAAQLFPSQLSAYYAQRSKGLDVLDSVLGIQASLQSQIDAKQTPPTALRIMFISDMHLSANYPLVGRYADSYGVDLIVNTGDESEFATRVELTPGYLDSLRQLTAKIPMLWLAGNHDSPDTQTMMRSIPGVTVLGSKSATDSGYSVEAGVVDAFGLTIAGVPDPRVYGGPGAYGADDSSVTEPLERKAVDRALAGLLPSGTGDGTSTAPTNGAHSFDIFATHEPPAADELRTVLPGRIRQTNAGHTHEQNGSGDLQGDDGSITLVEGSTGAGGLDNIYRGAKRPPIEFSIESVAADCQFTRVLRFAIRSAAPTGTGADVPQAYGDDVTTTTTYFRPQKLAADRTCNTRLGIGSVGPL